MKKTKPTTILYSEKTMFLGTELVDGEGNSFKSTKAMADAKLSGDFNSIKPISVVFCPECHAGARASDWGFDEPTQPYWEEGISKRAKKHKGQCPNCGMRINLLYQGSIDNSSYHSQKDIDGNPVVVRHVNSSSPAPLDYALKYWDVSEDGKMAFETTQRCFRSFTACGRYRLLVETLRYRLIFNFRTGQTYIMRGVDQKGQPSKWSYCQTRLINQTCHVIRIASGEMGKDLTRVLMEHMVQNYNIPCSFHNEIEKNGYRREYCLCGAREVNVNNLTWVNYFKTMKPDDLIDMLCLQSYAASDKWSREYFNKLRLLSSENEVSWLPKYMQKRSIRHRLNKRVLTFYIYKWLYACGIRDVNIMNAIVDEYIDKHDCVHVWGQTISSKKQDRTLAQFVSSVCMEKSAVNFLKWVFKDRTPESIKSFIASMSNSYWLGDTARMFKELEGYIPDDLDRTGSIKEIHDRFSDLLNQYRFGNRVIKYSPTELKLESDCDGFTFELPKDTDSLYQIGKEMRICVGSYSADAFHKRCVIVTMNKGHKHIACIELRKYKGHMKMYQLKGKFNHTVEEVEPIVTWAATNNINVDCCDYHNAVNREANRFDGRNVDYHVANPRLNDDNDYADEGLNAAFYGAPANPFGEFLPF